MVIAAALRTTLMIHQIIQEKHLQIKSSFVHENIHLYRQYFAKQLPYMGSYILYCICFTIVPQMTPNYKI